MPEVTWIKVLTSIRRNKKMLIIRSMPEGDALCCIWLDLLCMAGDQNDRGNLYINKDLPYTDETLGAVLNRTPGITRLAIETFKQFDMISVDVNGYIMLTGFADIQNVEGMERLREGTRKRVAAHREREKVKELTSGVTLRNVTVTGERREEKSIKEQSNDIWNNVLINIQTNVSALNFKTFYANTTLHEKYDNAIMITAPNEQIAKYLEENAKGLIEKAVFDVTGENLELKIVLGE